MNTSVEQTIQDAAAQHIDQSNQSFAKLRLVANTQWKTVEVNGEDVEIPQGWDVKKIGDITICLDNIRKPLSQKERAFKKGLIPYWGANSIVDYVNEYLFNGKCILLGEDAAPFFDKSKKVSFVISGKIWPNNHIHILQTTQDYEYLSLKLNDFDYSKVLNTKDRPKLTQGTMNRMEIAFPPLSEQTLIAQILTTQEEHVANLKQQSSVQRKRLDWLTSELLTGRILVHEDINGEPTVLERDDQGNVLKSLPAVTMSANTQWKTVEVNGEDVEIPQWWDVKKIGNDINFTLGYTPSKTGTNYKGDIPWITISNLDNSGHVKNFTALIKNSRTRILPKGSLIGSFKMTIGRFGITCMDAVTNEAIVGAAPNDAPLHDLNYLRFALVSPFKKGAVTNGQGVQLLNTKIIKSLQFISPQKSEQTLIAQILTTQEEHISSLDKAIELEEQRLAWLTDELLSGRILVEEVTK